MKKQYIIPIFVPHLGCPNDCTFCNQRKISGQLKNVTENDVRDTIEFYLSNFKEKNAYKEVAFYGGSFTGIDVDIQEKLLATVYEYIKLKKIDGIRVSTRPDYIDKTVLKRLKKYKVKTIELGVQSTNDYVLKKCKRGHTYEDVVKASKLIRRYRFNLGHQMMIGLPESTENDDLQTAKDLIKLKPKMIRIYPVLIIKGTELEKEYNDGNYEPLALNIAVERCKELCYLFSKKKINVIRIGLQNTDTICSPNNEGSEVVAGPYHETFRQLVEASIYYDTIVEKIKKFDTKVKEVEVVVNPQTVNNVVGYKRENIQKLKDMYDVDVVIKQDIKRPVEKIDVHISKRFKEFLDDNEKFNLKKSLRNAYILVALIYVTSIAMFIGLFHLYDLSLPITLIFLGFELLDFALCPIYYLRTSFLQLNWSASKTTANRIFARAARLFLALLPTPYCSSIASISATFIQLATTKYFFKKNFLIDKNGRISKRPQPKQSLIGRLRYHNLPIDPEKY